MKRKSKNKRKYQVKCLNINNKNELKKYVLKLSQLSEINNLLSKNLITKSEYEEIKRAIGFFSDF